MARSSLLPQPISGPPLGNEPADPRFTELATALTDASSASRQWWADYPIRDFRPATITINHPQVGPIALELFQLHPVESSDLLLVTQLSATDDDLQRVQSLVG